VTASTLAVTVALTGRLIGYTSTHLLYLAYKAIHTTHTE
jgi:hypothetical protein